MEDLITIEVTPTFAQYWRFGRTKLYRVLRSFVVIAILLVLWIALLGALVHGLAGIGPMLRDYSWVFILFGVWFVLVPWATYRTIKRTWRESPFHREQKTYQISHVGLAYSGQTLAGSTAWCNISSAVSSGPIVILHMNRVQAYLIPTSAFRDQQQLEDFKTLLRLYVRDCRRL